jgi:hypothetical protein
VKVREFAKRLTDEAIKLGFKPHSVDHTRPHCRLALAYRSGSIVITLASSISDRRAFSRRTARARPSLTPHPNLTEKEMPMAHDFYDHHRLVEIAERYDLVISDDVDTETALRDLLDELKIEDNLLAWNIGFVERYLDKTYGTAEPDAGHNVVPLAAAGDPPAS